VVEDKVVAKGKRESYYERWRREHPRIQFYLNRDK